MDVLAAAVAVSISGVIVGLLVAALIVVLGKWLAATVDAVFFPIAVILAILVFIALAFSFSS